VSVIATGFFNLGRRSGAGLATIRGFDNRAKTIMIPTRHSEMFDT